MKEEEKIEAIINYIDSLFDFLRGNWGDNRWACREGREAVSRLRELMGEKFYEPYRYTENETDDDYYDRISKYDPSIKFLLFMKDSKP